MLHSKFSFSILFRKYFGYTKKDGITQKDGFLIAFLIFCLDRSNSILVANVHFFAPVYLFFIL